MKTAQVGITVFAFLAVIVTCLIGQATAQDSGPAREPEMLSPRKVVEEAPVNLPGFGAALDPTLYPDAAGTSGIEAAGSCCHICGEGCCAPPLWTIDLDAEILGRDRCRGVVLATAGTWSSSGVYSTSTLR